MDRSTNLKNMKMDPKAGKEATFDQLAHETTSQKATNETVPFEVPSMIPGKLGGHNTGD